LSLGWLIPLVRQLPRAAPGCRMRECSHEDGRTAAEVVPGVSEVDVGLVWDPAVRDDPMSDAVRLLGLSDPGVRLGDWASVFRAGPIVRHRGG
jgi:metal-sulfur cluster biosynthetic enzyme